jgi:hypothetical protein
MKYSRFKPSKIFIRMSMLGNKAIDPPMPMNSEEIVLTCGKHLSSKEAEAGRRISISSRIRMGIILIPKASLTLRAWGKVREQSFFTIKQFEYGHYS